MINWTKKILPLLLSLLLSNTTQAQNIDSSTIKAPKAFPSWTLFVPGGTYFYNGRIAEGLTFSAIEIGGIGLGINYNNSLKSNSSSPYYNYPLFVGLKAFDVDKCDFIRNRLEIVKFYNPKFSYDPMSEKELYLSPFRSKNIFTPITLGFVGLALAQLYFDGQGISTRISSVKQMYFLNRYIDRNPALAIYGTTSMALSWGAGVSEEYFFRNALMPLLDFKHGKEKGLYYSSVTFGAMHLSNVLFSDKPDYSQALAQVCEATIAGYILGRDVQNRGYKIGPAVAAHVWYDFTLMLGSFLINPKQNVFAVNVKLSL